jgi:TRAP transporter TAXI family solute receptor
MHSDKGPRVDLTMVGDWGTANFHTILGWISAHMRWRSAPRSKFTIKTGSAYREGVELVGTGEADLAITTPSHMGVRWALEGRHFYGGRAFPHLRTLGCLPQDDRLTLAVRADTGITSFGDIRRTKPRLHIATPARDENNLCSYVIDLIFRAHGIEPADIVAWGGSFFEHESPRVCLRAALDGNVTAVFNEAIMVSQWSELVAKTPMRFIGIEAQAMKQLVDVYGLKPAVIEKGRLANDADVPCLDWSNWATVVRDDMPEDLAYRITAVMVEERAEFEARFRHIPVQHSPLTYPIEPSRMPQGVGIPLHPGAARYYREHGYLA